MKLNKIEEAVKDYTDYFDEQKPKSAPSGEWAEYNVDYLQDGAFLDGMISIMDTVGTCKECKIYSLETQYCKHLDLHIQENWYCADFKRLEKSDENV